MRYIAAALAIALAVVTVLWLRDRKDAAQHRYSEGKAKESIERMNMKSRLHRVSREDPLDVEFEFLGDDE